MSSDVFEEVVDGDLSIEPGACFGWFSPLALDCNPSHCLRSEWCRQYTINNVTKEEESRTMKLELEDLGKETKITSQTNEQKKTKKKVMAEMGKQAFFDKAVNATASLIKHDSIKYNAKRNMASLKIGGRVVSFLSRKREAVHLELGGRNQGGEIMKIEFGDNGDTIKDLIKPFVDRAGFK